jgi:hypothetical protein
MIGHKKNINNSPQECKRKGMYEMKSCDNERIWFSVLCGVAMAVMIFCLWVYLQ